MPTTALQHALIWAASIAITIAVGALAASGA